MSSVVCYALSLFELGIFFVQSIVCQMNKHISHHLSIRIKINLLIRLSSKSHKTFFVKENLKGITTHDQNIDSHVKFKAVNQVWRIYILLDNGGLNEWDTIYIVRNKDSLSLTHEVWFTNHSKANWFSIRSWDRLLAILILFCSCWSYTFRWNLLHIPQIVYLIRENPGSWKEVVFIWVNFLQSLQISG
jgi:hypothetical protein